MPDIGIDDFEDAVLLPFLHLPLTAGESAAVRDDASFARGEPPDGRVEGTYHDPFVPKAATVQTGKLRAITVSFANQH